ncbi:unnamed protein product [Notodromas monacha]|uniref:Uncharacterized protein n=1 Tax=Notodromas monacha TaxID=399045 RepID=A0A7R9BD08_9CRUS|nr:unnamed protein product [Notodromas monacha]CAG0912269.1 unnamed protein product [Notodromas monacha]
MHSNAFSVVASTLTILNVLSPTNAAPLDGVFAVAASAGSESAPVQSNPNAKPGFSYGFAHTAPLASFGAPHHGHRQGTNDADAEGYLATQYHTQSNVGDAAFGYAHPGQAHASIRDANGGVTGYGFAHTAPLASFGAPHHGHRQGTNDADAEGYLATQYHTQSNVGDAAFGYAHPGQAHASIRDANGGVTGSYSYISPEGHPIHVLYVADAAGFRVISNALPDANGDIPLHAQATAVVMFFVAFTFGVLSSCTPTSVGSSVRQSESLVLGGVVFNY